MPDSEPLPGAPESIWAGEQDAQLYFTQIGMPWLAPFAAPFRPRIVHVAELCSAGPPATSPITLSDIVALQLGGETADAAQLKLHEWVDRGLWEGNCRYVDDSVPPPVVPQDPPEGLPPGPPPSQGSDRMIRDLHEWTSWSVRQFIPRSYHVGSEQFVSGTGSITFVQDATGDWPVWPAGVIVTVQAKPDYVGRSNGGDFPVYYDLGWFSLANGTNAQSPIRLQHEMQMVYGSIARVNLVYYNLAPDVDVSIAPLYPDTSEHIAE